jgi:hypothetical protein
VTVTDILHRLTALRNFAAKRSRFAAPHAERSEQKASVNNALLGVTCCLVCIPDPN